jgi:hypothetical protein
MVKKNYSSSLFLYTFGCDFLSFFSLLVVELVVALLIFFPIGGNGMRQMKEIHNPRKKRG